MQLTLLGSAIALLVLWLFVRNRGQSKKTSAPEKPKATEDTAYHAVSIKFDANACEAAKMMSGRRFLSTAAPRLPLPDCNALECRCVFAHHKDRRAAKDRRSPFGAAGYAGGTGSYEKERRESRDRRKEADLDEFY
jgi:hypothetical protein